MKSTLSRLLIAVLLLTVGGIGANSQTIIDTGEPAKVLRFGVRIGFTSSNLTKNYDERLHRGWRGRHKHT